MGSTTVSFIVSIQILKLKKLKRSMEKRIVSLAQFVVKRRLYVILASIFLVFAISSGMKNLAFDTNYRVFFSKENPQLKAFDELQNTYTKTDNITFVLKPKSGDAFSREVLSAVSELTEESWKLPYSSRVDSISNYQHTYAEGDDLTVIDLVEGDPYDLTDGEINYIRQVSLNEPLLVKNLVPVDGSATGVNVTFTFPEKDIMEVPVTNKAALGLLNKLKEKYPNIEMRASGMVSLNDAFAQASQQDMKNIIPLMYLVLLVTMLLFLKSILSVVATLLIIAFSAIGAMGITGLLGIHLTPPSVTAPTIILTLAIADSVHVIVSMLKEMRRGMAKNDAIIESVRINFQPVFLTSFTTIIGFLTLNFSDAPPFRDLGNITAIGVFLAFVFSVTFLPALLSILPISVNKQEEGKVEFVERIGELVIQKRKQLAIVMIAIVVFLGVMIPRLEVDDQWVEYFDHSIPFRGDSEFVMDNLTGIYRIEYSVKADRAGGVTDPEYLKKLEEYTDWLRTQKEVSHVYSVIDIFKRLNKNMHGDDINWYRIPDNQELAAQYLLLYEFSLPYGLDLNDRINIDKSATRVTVTLDGDTPTSVIKDFKNRSENWLRENTPKAMHTEATSPPVMFAYIAERNINSMITGNIIALFLISLIIMISLKNVRIGFISLIPNLVPPIMGFGIWALLVGQVNMAVAFVTAISLGIIVDDTVHFLSKYNRARREKGLNAEEAVRYAFSTVGSALVITSFVLVFGFGVLMISAFKMNSLMGMLTSIIIAVALIADFLLLPPILMFLDKFQNGKKSKNK